MAAQHADTAFADTHFAQTQMVLANGALRSDEEGDLKVFKARVDALRAMADDSERDEPRSTPPSRRFEDQDAKLYARVKRGDRVGATELVSSSVDEAADGVTARHRHLHRPRQPRARGRPTQRFASAKAGATRLTLIIGALALLAALAPGLRARPPPHAAAWCALSRAAEALAEGDVDHELSVEGRDEVGRTAAALASMVDHLRALAGAADRVAAGDLTVDVSPRSERDRLGAAFAGLVAELRAAVSQMSRSATSVAGASRARRLVVGRCRPRGRGDRPRAGRRRRRHRAPGALGDLRARHDRAGRRRHHRLAPRTPHETSRAADEARAAAGVGAETVARATEAMAAVRDASAEASQAIRELGSKSRAHRRHRRHHHGHRRADQPAGAQRRHRGGARRRAGPRLRRRGRGGPQAGRGVPGRREVDRHLVNEIRARPSAPSPSSRPAPSAASRREHRRRGARRLHPHRREHRGRLRARERGRRPPSSRSPTGPRHVTNDIVEVASVAEQSSATVQQVSASAQETSASTQQIAASAQELSRTARELDELVGRFTL